MKNLSIICFTLLVGISGLPVFAKDPPSSAEQLRNELESALKAKDTNAVISLFDWEGVDDYVKWSMIMPLTRSAMQNANNIADVILSPLSSDYQAVVGDERNDWWGDNGRRAKFNITVLGKLDILIPAQDKIRLPYGKKGDSFYLAGLIAYQAPGKSLYVRVLGYPVSLTYTGFWTYVKDGKEITVNISDRTNQFREGWGDYIKCFTIQRTSTSAPGHGDFYFEISEGGTNIFKSPQITNENSVVWEKK